MNTNIKIFKDRKDEFALLADYISQQAAGGRTIEILEAGCGRQWPLHIEGLQYVLTGIDLDAVALAARKRNDPHLTHTIHGDINKAELEPHKYDVIYSSYVLEHIVDVPRVLANFSRWLKPGGIIIVRVPDRDSFHGLVTRITPFWVHVAYYRYIRNRPNAGKPGYSPYPTIYDPAVSRKGIKAFAAKNRFTVREVIGHGSLGDLPGFLGVVVPIAGKIFELLSLGAVHSRFTDITYVLQADQK